MNKTLSSQEVYSLDKHITRELQSWRVIPSISRTQRRSTLTHYSTYWVRWISKKFLEGAKELLSRSLKDKFELSKTVAPNPFGTRDWFHRRQFFFGWGMGKGTCFRDDSSALHLLCTLLLLYLLHLRSSGIRSQRVGTRDLGQCWWLGEGHLGKKNSCMKSKRSRCFE